MSSQFYLWSDLLCDHLRCAEGDRSDNIICLNSSRYSDVSERTYRRHSEQPYAFMGLNRETIELAIAPSHFQVSALDASFIPKSGKATYGVDYFHNGKAGRSERGLEISMIAVVDVETSIGYTLSVQQTPTSESTSERTRVDHYLDHLRATRAAMPATVRYLVGDGFYSKRKWVDGVVELGLDAIGKLRHDANLKYLYDGPQKLKGARRKYDGKVNLSQRHRWQALGKVDPTLDIYLYSTIVWSVAFKRKIRVVYLINCKHPERPCFALLFSTDLTLEPVEIYRAYKARFQVEFIFRDAKQFTGLTDCQARDEQKLNFHFNASLSALNLAKYEQYQQRDTEHPFVFSMASYKRRKLNHYLLEQFICKLDLGVGSREATMPRPSQLDPHVPVSVHTAPDVLSYRFCSCERIDGNFDESLEGYYPSSCCGCHQCDATQLSH